MLVVYFFKKNPMDHHRNEHSINGMFCFRKRKSHSLVTIVRVTYGQAYLGVWLRLLFKVFFTQKSMSIIFFFKKKNYF